MCSHLVANLHYQQSLNSYMSSLQTKTVSNRELAKLIDRANKACNNGILTKNYTL